MNRLKRFSLLAVVIPLTLILILILEARRVICIFSLFLVVYGASRWVYQKGKIEGAIQERKAVAGKIRAIREDQIKGFVTQAREGILRLENGGE